MVEQGTATPEIEFWKAERSHRRAKEVSQRDAAQIFGHNQSTLSRKESRGGTLPSREEVIIFTNQLGLEPIEREELLTIATYAWSVDFYEELVQMLRAAPDKDKVFGGFSVRQLEEIMTSGLRILNEREASLGNQSKKIA